jgi:hypothetical protein
MTDSARRGGQQARARVRPLDRWPQLRPDDRGCGKVNRRVDVPRLQIELLGPGGTRCSGLPVGWWTRPARYRVPPRARRPCRTIPIHGTGMVWLWSPMMAVGQGAGHDRAQQAGPQGDPRSHGASPRPIGAAIRLSLAAAPAVLGVQHDAARTPSRRRASVSATRCRNSLGFWFQDRRSTARRSDRLTNRDPALPALTDCAHGTDNLAWKSH